MVIKNQLDLSALHLEHGSHEPDSHYCLLEAAAYMAGETWSDHPQCVSPVIASFGRSLNDEWDDAQRQKLVPYLPRMIGTATGPDDERLRAHMLCDWLVRIYAPAWLDLVESCKGDAATLRGLSELRDADDFTAATPAIIQARTHAAAAGRAAGRAAWDAAWGRCRGRSPTDRRHAPGVGARSAWAAL